MTKRYLSENEELMKEWDWEANEGLNPKSIYMISIDTNEILKEFNSTREAAREMCVYEGSIRKVCARNRKSAYGYIWRYADDEETKNMKK